MEQIDIVICLDKIYYLLYLIYKFSSLLYYRKMEN